MGASSLCLLCPVHLIGHGSDLALRQRGKATAELFHVDIQHDLVPADELDYVVLVTVSLH